MAQETLTESLSKKLITIAIDVSAEDRKKCVKDLEIGKSTLSEYLKGDVRDTSTAEKIYVFLNNRLLNRKANT